MKKITRWHPDTCSCIIDFEWDTEDTQAPHNVKNVVKVCQAHEGCDTETNYSNVLIENRNKNKIVNYILNNVPEFVDKDIFGNKFLKEGRFSYFFDENRKLIAFIPELPTNHKDIIESDIGTNKVSING